MSADRKPLQNFNLETMSGVYPGSRTMVYQRLRLHAPGGESGQWYQLQWMDSPASAILLSLGSAPKSSAAPVFILEEPAAADFVVRLHDRLEAAGLQADACYSCRNWQALAARTEDGVPVGRCRWQDGDAALPAALVTQSALSLACSHHDRIHNAPTVATHASVNAGATRTTPPRVLKSAELDVDRLPFWPRLWHRLRRRSKRVHHWSENLLERSGVGAGTEPCFVCQGRLANLGAVAVASAEGDKQTFSVWRCRGCYTLYLNDWTDRWERLENLETEERYFRLAPAEAYTALNVIHTTQGGEHPGRRHEREQERAAILQMIGDKAPLSHQVRQGR